jgi:hypothetical protein
MKQVMTMISGLVCALVALTAAALQGVHLPDAGPSTPLVR